MKPDETDSTVKRLLEGLRPTQPPPELRSHVLAAARDRIDTVSRPDVWSRIWNHRGIRLAWAATVALFLIAHFLVEPRSGTAVTRMEPAMVAQSRPDAQFVDILRPIPISTHVHPIIGLFATAGDPNEIAMGGNSS
jgi:hypothetical protein